jgi:O-antigen/teichoic acid export membrane protein
VNPSVPMRRRSVDAGLVFAGHVLGVGLAFLAGLLAARVFEPALRGEYAMLTTAAAFVSVLASLGFSEAIIFFYRRGEADAQRTVTSIVFVNGAISLLVLGAGFAICPWLARHYFPSGGLAAAWVAVGAGLLSIFVRNGLVFLQAQGDFLRSSVIGLVQPALFVAALAAIGLAGGGFGAAIAAFLAAWALPAVVLVLPMLRLATPRALDPVHFGRVARFSAKSYANVAMGQLNYRVDMFVIGSLIPDLARLADYHIASTLAGLIWILPDAYATAIYPRLAGLSTERERSTETVMAVRVVLAPVIVVAIGLCVTAPLLVPFVFGERYAGAVPLTLLLLPGTVCMSVNKVLARYFLSSNRQQVAAVAMGVGVVVDVGALLLLIPSWGVAAASIAASLAYFASLVLSGTAFLISAELRREDFRGFPRREIQAFLSAARNLSATSP